MKATESEDTPHFRVGDILKCKCYVERKDGRSAVHPGQTVKVLSEFKFPFEGKQLQDLVIQHKDDMPIGVIVKPGHWEKIST